MPAFGQDWARALEDSRRSYSLTPLQDVVRSWQARLTAALSVEAFLALGRDDSDGVDLADALADAGEDMPWPARLSPGSLATLRVLPEHACEMFRDVLDIAGRDPWSFPAYFDSRNPEGEDVRSASVGQLTAVYCINRLAGRLYVLDIVWLG